MDRSVCEKAKSGLSNNLSDSRGKMSDGMASQRITVRVPRILGARLRDRSRARGQTPSDLVRMALENFLGAESNAQSAYETAEQAGLIGCARQAPRDLSIHPRHMKNFGKR